MSYKTRVEDLIGAVGDDALITQSLKDSATKILEVAPLEILEKSATSNSVSSSGTTVSNQIVLSAYKDTIVAKKINYHELAKYKDSGSIYYASANDPVYYFIGTKIYIVADGAATTGHYTGVDKTPGVAYDDSNLQGFPTEAEYLMVLGASLYCIQRKITDLTLPTIKVPPLPVVPILTDNSITFTTTPPEYVVPVVSPSFSKVDTYIETDEDVELAGMKLRQIETQLNEYNSNIQNQLNIFNDQNVEYQAELQKAIQNAKLSQEDDAQALQKFQLELQDYQAEVQAEVQKHSTDLATATTDFQLLQARYQGLKTEYTEGLQIFMTGEIPREKGDA